jgi:hypothetical protein
MFLLAANVRHIFSLSKDNNCIALVQNHDPFCGRLLPENDAGSSIASQAVCSRSAKGQQNTFKRDRDS